jgi:drug/metabolite transporter (DMT)-like permease
VTLPASASAFASTPMRRAGLIFAVLGAVAFSAKAIIVKLAYRHGVDAVTLIMLRMALALPMFVALAWWAGRGKPALERRDLVAVAGLGFVGYYASSMLDFLGLQYITAGLERLILYINPTLVLLMGWLLFGRRATLAQGAAMAIAYAGIALVFAHDVRLEGSNVALGAALVFASAVTYAIYLVTSGEVVKRLGAMRLTGWATGIACVLCMLQYVLLRPLAELSTIPGPVWWLSLLNATLCTFAPVVLVMLAIERVGPALTSQIGMLGPLSTITMGVWLLGEPLHATLVAGTVLVLAGVTLLARSK